MANNHTAGAAARTFAPSELCQRMLAKTSKGACGPCILYLEDGTIFYGRACGAEGTATGEVCFNTSLEGYFEVMTDPSYAGQIVTMTYPQIGNYGIDETDVQSAFPGDAVRPASAPAMRGMIVRDMCATPSNWRSAVSVPEYLRAHGIVAIEGVDTRALVRHLRDNGSKMGIISTEIFDVDELAERLDAAPTLVGENLVKTVSCPAPHEFVAADLLSQAEHDKLASPVLVTDSRDLAKAVQAELEVQIPQLPRAAIARASVDTNGKIIVTDDMNKAIEAVNIIAPEHLEICVDDPFAVLNSVQNAGSIFLGKNVPEALGDYFAGPNHTLPTSGTARFSSPLGVDDFVKKSSFIYYTREALGEVQGRIANFAEHEGLHAHARSVTIRFEE